MIENKKFHCLFSSTVGCKMKFGIYVPEKAEKERVPLLIFLSGLLEFFSRKYISDQLNRFNLYGTKFYY